jgi:transposase-like protein
MTQDHRRVDPQMTQEVLRDDPAFLREIVQRVVRQILEAEMSEHIGGGAAPYERPEGRTGHRNGHEPETLRTRVGTLNLLVPQDIGKGRCQLAASPATRGTRRRCVWP